MKEPKTGKLFCVNCNVYVVPEAEYEAAKAAQAVSQNKATPAQEAPSSTAVEPEKPSNLSIQPYTSASSPVTSKQVAEELVPAKVSPSTQHSAPSASVPVHREHVQLPHVSSHGASSAAASSTLPHEAGSPAASAHAYAFNVAHNALMTLALKLEELTELCRSTTLSSDQMRSNFAAMTDCANALGVVHRTALEMDRRH